MWRSTDFLQQGRLIDKDVLDSVLKQHGEDLLRALRCELLNTVCFVSCIFG